MEKGFWIEGFRTAVRQRNRGIPMVQPEAQIYLPKEGKLIPISERDLTPQERESKEDYLTRRRKIEEQLNENERNMFGRSMLQRGLKCSKCPWLHFSEEQKTQSTDFPPYCWLYGRTRPIKGNTPSEIEESFESLACIGETDDNYFAQRIARIPAKSKKKGRVIHIRRLWFKKTFPATYRKLNEKQLEILDIHTKKIYSKKELKEMGPKARKLAEKKMEIETQKVKRKFKMLASKISVEDKVRLRIQLLSRIAKNRKIVLDKLKRHINYYSAQYMKWSTKPYYSILVNELRNDLNYLNTNYIHIKTMRKMSPYDIVTGKYRTVQSIFNIVKKNADRYGKIEHQKPPLHIDTIHQMKIYAELMELGIFDYEDFDKKSSARLRKYLRRKKIKVGQRMPSVLSDKVYEGWMQAKKYKEWRKSIPDIHKEMYWAMRQEPLDLLKMITIKDGILRWKRKLPLEKRIAVLNAILSNFSEPLHRNITSSLTKERILFDAKYSSKISNRPSMLQLPLRLNQMYLYNKKTRNSILDMTTEQLQMHDTEISEDIRYSPRYRKFVKSTLSRVALLDKEFMKIQINPVVDIDPITGKQYRELSIHQKMISFSEAEKVYRSIMKEFAKRKIKTTDMLRYGPSMKKKPLNKMSFSEMIEAFRLLTGTQLIKRVEEKKPKTVKKKPEGFQWAKRIREIKLSKGTKKKVLGMTVYQLRYYLKEGMEEGIPVKFSRKYARYLNEKMSEVNKLIKSFRRYKVNFERDLIPGTSLPYRDVPIGKLSEVLKETVKTYKKVQRKFKELGMKKNTKLPYSKLHKGVKPISRMSLSQMLRAIEIKTGKKLIPRKIMPKESKEEKPEEKPKVFRDSISISRMNMRVTVDYDVSGKALVVWGTEYQMAKERPGPFIKKEIIWETVHPLPEGEEAKYRKELSRLAKKPKIRPDELSKMQKGLKEKIGQIQKKVITGEMTKAESQKAIKLIRDEFQKKQIMFEDYMKEYKLKEILRSAMGKKEKKRARKILKTILIGLSEIKGLEMIGVIASPMEISQYRRLGFKPMTAEMRKKLADISYFDKPFLRNVNLYMQ